MWQKKKIGYCRQSNGVCTIKDDMTDMDSASANTTIAYFRGYADCVKDLKEMGVICSAGIYEKGQIQHLLFFSKLCYNYYNHNKKEVNFIDKYSQ